jgi:hypothetical protein
VPFAGECDVVGQGQFAGKFIPVPEVGTIAGFDEQLAAGEKNLPRNGKEVIEIRYMRKDVHHRDELRSGGGGAQILRQDGQSPPCRRSGFREHGLDSGDAASRRREAADSLHDLAIAGADVKPCDRLLPLPDIGEHPAQDRPVAADPLRPSPVDDMVGDLGMEPGADGLVA